MRHEEAVDLRSRPLARTYARHPLIHTHNPAGLCVVQWISQPWLLAPGTRRRHNRMMSRRGVIETKCAESVKWDLGKAGTPRAFARKPSRGRKSPSPIVSAVSYDPRERRALGESRGA